VLLQGEPSLAVGLASHSCRLWDLCAGYGAEPADREPLLLGRGWSAAWSAVWRRSGSVVVVPVRGLASAGLAGCEPVRRFGWRSGQRHRPGLQYLVSTGRHHGFESVAEQRVLLVLDFAGGVVELLAQPFRLRFATRSGWWEHIPDFLACTRGGMVLDDDSQEGPVKADDLVRFAASEEAALVAAWRYFVVTGWRPHVLSTVDTLSAQRRPLGDRLGLRPRLVAAAAGGPVPFGQLVEAGGVAAVGRAQALHLLWHRRLSIDLSGPLTNSSLVSAVPGGDVR
jgi:hypothetical protein